ncbi:hypothetical protein [Nostoc sp. PA-18-2419]|uniref:hypothetical protein n=1 Tax=Nostoc sp. PA-18-2419 TaxID=2575443 RepID=UPI001109CE69|nr:hypothetical protein [Nostoc sp. PA-18-2419]
MGKININQSKLNSIINQAFDVVVEVQGEAFQNAIASPIWEWPRETVRKNGETVGSPRDRVDTEELIDSLVISRTRDAAEYEWESDHATIVHDGATLQDGTELPGTSCGSNWAFVWRFTQRLLNRKSLANALQRQVTNGGTM